MQKIKLVRVTFLSLLLLASTSSHASETERKGFVLGAGISAGFESYTLQKFGEGITLKAGYGFHDRFLSFYEFGASHTTGTLQDIGIWDHQLKLQYFIWKNIYLMAGGGITQVSVFGQSTGTITTGISRVSSFTSKLGFIGSAALGDEFQFSKNFFISPEVEVNYRGIDDNSLIGKNYVTELVRFRIGWYF